MRLIPLLVIAVMLVLGGCTGNDPEDTHMDIQRVPPAPAAQIAAPAIQQEELPDFVLAETRPAMKAAELQTGHAKSEGQKDGSLLYRNSELKFRMRIPAELKDKVWVQEMVAKDNPEKYPELGEMPARKNVAFFVLRDAPAQPDSRRSQNMRSDLEKLQLTAPPGVDPGTIDFVYVFVCTDAIYKQKYKEVRDADMSEGAAQSSVCNFSVRSASKYTSHPGDITVPAVSDDTLIYAMLASFRTDTDPLDDTPIIYRNREYGFELTIPNVWKDYRIETKHWKAREDDDPQESKYPRETTFSFSHPALDKMAQDIWGIDEGTDPWDPLHVICVPPKKWYGWYTNESGQSTFYYQKEGENKKCVFGTSITNGSMINTLITARIYSILHSFRALPVP